MKRFQSPEQAQRFLSTFESINTAFRFRRHLLSAACYRRRLTQALQLWRATALGVALP
jgi:putative transposase